jgi:DNA-binding Xre family transcriptional regulator
MGKCRYNIQDVHERTGLARATVSALYNDKATRIDFTTIEKLCLLFECGIEQILSLEPTEPGNANDDSLKLVSAGGKTDV